MEQWCVGPHWILYSGTIPSNRTLNIFTENILCDTVNKSTFHEFVMPTIAVGTINIKNANGTNLLSLCCRACNMESLLEWMMRRIDQSHENSI